MKDYLLSLFKGKRILILGCGKEGQSTYNYLKIIYNNFADLVKYDTKIVLADKNPDAFTSIEKYEGITTESGPAYLSSMADADFVIKSPGISLKEIGLIHPIITSQTALFLAVYGKQVIGVTGTKGKSTTAGLIYHILKSSYTNTLFGGNIGTPLFDLIDQINELTHVVCELSSHQLQFTQHSPHISILLNIYEEHLDHYKSYEEYQLAKFNIALYQTTDDYFIYNSNDSLIKKLVNNYQLKSKLIPYISPLFDILPEGFNTRLTGAHNRQNAKVAAAVAALKGVPTEKIKEAISTFEPLKHRLEFIGTFKGTNFYNDSISTIAEATIAAVESIKPVATLILGGFDRGIDYLPLEEYLKKGNVRNIVTTGPAGLRIFNQISFIDTIEELYYFDKFDEAVIKAFEITPAGGKCLLSPAASSYNEFKNFEERGLRFEELIKKRS